jgi:SAM-dependent methyltransferase
VQWRILSDVQCINNGNLFDHAGRLSIGAAIVFASIIPGTLERAPVGNGRRLSFLERTYDLDYGVTAGRQKSVKLCGKSGSQGMTMINSGHVHIHQFSTDGAVVDAAALDQFQQQWATYGRLVSANSLSHREVTRMLHATLADEFAAPFNFLDIACGDASIMPDALRDVPVRHYHGIDLSQPALELAAANLDELPCAVDLDHRDFFEALTRRTEHADAAWCSLSIHHLESDNKLDVFKAVRDALGAGGSFLLYEPTRLDGEDRAGYLERFRRTNHPLWDYLSELEWGQIWDHVSTCDFPESAADWLGIGRAAGFGSGRQLFADPTDLYRLFRFDA